MGKADVQPSYNADFLSPKIFGDPKSNNHSQGLPRMISQWDSINQVLDIKKQKDFCLTQHNPCMEAWWRGYHGCH